MKVVKLVQLFNDQRFALYFFASHLPLFFASFFASHLPSFFCKIFRSCFGDIFYAKRKDLLMSWTRHKMDFNLENYAKKNFYGLALVIFCLYTYHYLFIVFELFYEWSLHNFHCLTFLFYLNFRYVTPWQLYKCCFPLHSFAHSSKVVLYTFEYNQSCILYV